MWKDSIVVPVAKVKCPKALNDYCPVTLMSIVMKSFEHAVKGEILHTVHDILDLLQFA